MYTTYHLTSAQELNNEIIEAIKASFKEKAITITVEEEADETAYLMSNASNKAMLQQSLQQAKDGQLVEVQL